MKAGRLIFLIVLFFSSLKAQQPATSQQVETGPSWQQLPPGTQALERALSAKEYFIGPGDGIVIGIWGERNLSYSLTITPEGKILIPGVGEFFVSGLNLDQLREKMREEINRVFHNVEVTVTLTKLRLFEVYVLGEVKRPGIYLATAIDHVSELIQKAGGLTQRASRRRIELRRGGKLFKKADLFRFSALGDLEANPQVKDGDVIYVPQAKSKVSIYGAVYFPGTYEILPGETLGDLIEMARGFHPSAYLDSVEVAKFTEDNTTIERKYVSFNDTTASAVDLLLEDGDRVFVRSIPKWHYERSVTVEGEVKYPGIYPINKDETTLTEIIQRAGGFTSEASLEEAKVIRSVSESLKDAEFERLKNLPPSEMTDTEYEYYKMRCREVKGQMVVDFKRLFINGDKSQDIILKNGDRIIVPKFKNFINVTGQVAFPGNIKYQKGLSVDDYIKLAGGYAWNARKGKTRVIKARTGEWLWKKEVKQLEPGDTIWVPEKPERDWWELGQEIITAAAQVATVILVIQNAIRR